MHTYIHTCIHTYMHSYIHTYIHTYILTPSTMTWPTPTTMTSLTPSTMTSLTPTTMTSLTPSTMTWLTPAYYVHSILFLSLFLSFFFSILSSTFLVVSKGRNYLDTDFIEAISVFDLPELKQTTSRIDRPLTFSSLLVSILYDVTTLLLWHH